MSVTIAHTDANGLLNTEAGAAVTALIGDQAITDTDKTDLTDGGDTTLHHHDSDRDRANHTGTQAASTVTVSLGDDRTVTGLADYLANNAVFNVKDYGAIGDGSSHPLSGVYSTLADAQEVYPDATALTDEIDWCAIMKAVGQVPTTTGGGLVRIPAGTYRLHTSIDLTDHNNIALVGDGTRITVLEWTTRSVAWLIAADSETRHLRVQDMALFHSDRTIPDSATSGNYGIKISSISGTNIIEHVDVEHCGDSGIYIEGGTGPTTIRDSYIQFVAGYGVEIGDNGTASQDITIETGSIQSCWGGIKADNTGSLHLQDVDAELKDVAQFPPLYIASADGFAVTDCSFSVSSGQTITPNAIVALEAALGGVISGGINTGAGSAPNLLIGTDSDHNTIIGGIYHNTDEYFATFASSTEGVNTAFIHPRLDGYDSGKNAVNDAAGNNSVCIGVASAAGIDVNTNGVVFRSATKNVQFVMPSGDPVFYGANSVTSTLDMRLGPSGGTIADNDGTIRYRMDQNGRFTASAYRTTAAALTDGATVAVDATAAGYFTLAAGGSRTVGAPTNSASGQRLTFELLNNTAGAITTTWDSAYALAGAWADPAAAKRRVIEFRYNSTLEKWVEISRSAADIG